MTFAMRLIIRLNFPAVRLITARVSFEISLHPNIRQASLQSKMFMLVNNKNQSAEAREETAMEQETNRRPDEDYRRVEKEEEAIMGQEELRHKFYQTLISEEIQVMNSEKSLAKSYWAYDDIIKYRRCQATVRAIDRYFPSPEQMKFLAAQDQIRRLTRKEYHVREDVWEWIVYLEDCKQFIQAMDESQEGDDYTKIYGYLGQQSRRVSYDDYISDYDRRSSKVCGCGHI